MLYVYLHINETGVFYVGCGSKDRPWNTQQRSKAWKQVAESGHSVLIVQKFLDKQEAWKCEKQLIQTFKPSCNKFIGSPQGSGGSHGPSSREKMSQSHLSKKHPGSLLTEEAVLAIRRSLKTQREIAEDYGITRSLVSHIKLRKRWGHLV